MSRDLHEIFSSIHSIAKSREGLQKSNKKTSACLCSKNHDELNLKDEFEVHANENQDTEGIYIENTLSGAKFKLCPACNPRLNCTLCGGTGHMSFVHSYSLETKEGKSQYHSETIRPNACSCMRLEILVKKLNDSKIPDKYIQAELNNIDFSHIHEEQHKKKLLLNIEKIENFCSKSNINKKTKQKYFMTLFGPVGSGKTLLACAALKLLMTSLNITGKFIDFQYLLSELRSQYDDHKTGESILNELRQTDILVIDEFGKGRNDKEWQLEKLDELVNYRYNAQKITFITTNYLPQNIKYPHADIPFQHNKDIYSKDIPINETFWQQSLSERIGMRMYERILEVSEFVDFTNLPSYRKFLGKSFLDLYHSNNN